MMWLDKNKENTHIPDKYLSYVNTWKRQNPDYDVQFWDYQKTERLVQEHFPQYWNLFVSMKRIINKCDFARFMIVYVHGGLYVDLDFVCSKSIHPLLEGKNSFFVKEVPEHEYQGVSQLYNGIFGAKKGHPFVLGWIDYIAQTFKNSTPVLNSTGPVSFYQYYKNSQINVQLEDSCLVIPYTDKGKKSKICQKDLEPYTYTLWNDGSDWDGNPDGSARFQSGKNKKYLYINLLLFSLVVIVVVLIYKYKDNTKVVISIAILLAILLILFRGKPGQLDNFISFPQPNNKGKGLAKDNRILRNLFLEYGEICGYFEFQKNIAIHLESYDKSRSGEINMIYINPELTLKDLELLKKADYILCKYPKAVEYISKIRPECPVINTGFTSWDLSPPEYRTNTSKKVIHLGGQSHRKNTKLVIETYIKYPELGEITIICRRYCAETCKDLEFAEKYPYIKVYNTLEEAGVEYSDFGIFLCPSDAEGYGHYLNEAKVFGGIVITTDSPPMNDHVKDGETGLVVKTYLENGADGPFHVPIARFHPEDLAKAIKKAKEMDMKKRKEIAWNAYLQVVENHYKFKWGMRDFLDPRIRPYIFRDQKSLGNFFLVNEPIQNTSQEYYSRKNWPECIHPFSQKLRLSEKRISSQWEQDGILAYLLTNIVVPTTLTAVEFGARDYKQLNSTQLLQKNWNVILFDAEPGNPKVNGNIDGYKKGLVHKHWVTPENVNLLFTKYKVPKNLDLLTIDIDGNDYWVWQALDDNFFRPKIVVIEFNPNFGNGEAYTFPYTTSYYKSPTYTWSNEGYTKWYGASLFALCKLANRKGYSYVYHLPFSHAFFVRSDLLKPELQRLTPDDTGYHPVAIHNVDPQNRSFIQIR